MRTHRHTAAGLAAAAAALAFTGTATLTHSALAAAGGAKDAGAHVEFYPEDYDEVETFGAGEGFCVPWAGRFREVRTGGYRLVQAPGGREPGELHINGVINGYVELVPTDPTLPTYQGTYREKVNGVVVELGEDGDEERVGQYRLSSTLQGSDGSSYQLHLSGKVTFNANGTMTVLREEFTCV
jgi:hypothetical protein